MRWAQLLFTQGFGTRRECAALLHAGRVRHAGRIVEDGDEDIDPAGLEFEVEGKAWRYHERALLMLHKPAGYECSTRPGAWPGVLSLLPLPLRRRGVQSVGRLDQDTTGLLLLTDDGPLLHRLTSPKHHVAKVYRATLKHPLSDEQVARLLEGVVLDDDPKPVRAAAARRLDDLSLELTLTEGKYHQVKRMVAAVGNRVEALHRSRFGALELPADLGSGQWLWVEDPAAIFGGSRAEPATAPVR
ncbi:MAG TPA: 16S rRNA pseudouridine(516) synthase [Burkholderiaceae bacterium]|jgi:16S rRNA pseudouridine516 synthase|nr:16S rRNA pseudouridine(516) synthase [Burkholderiaceae bacterium]